MWIDQKQGCVGELKENIFSGFSFFKEHVRIKLIQSTAFTENKKRSDCYVLQWHTVVIIKLKSKVFCGVGNTLMYLLLLCIVRAKFANHSW